MHTFRNPNKIQVLQIRELLRGRKHVEMPQSRDGLVIEDLDLILRWFGPRTDYPTLDRFGRYRFVELKYGDAPLPYAQECTFQPIAEDLKDSVRFDGFYVVNYSDDDHDEYTTYRIDSTHLSSLQFCQWVIEPWSDIPRHF